MSCTVPTLFYIFKINLSENVIKCASAEIWNVFIDVYCLLLSKLVNCWKFIPEIGLIYLPPNRISVKFVNFGWHVYVFSFFFWEIEAFYILVQFYILICSLSKSWTVFFYSYEVLALKNVCLIQCLLCKYLKWFHFTFTTMSSCTLITVVKRSLSFYTF